MSAVSLLARILEPFNNLTEIEAAAHIESLERALGRALSFGEAEDLLFHVANVKGQYEDLLAVMRGERIAIPSGYDDFAETGFVTFAAGDAHISRAVEAYEWEQRNGRRWPGAPRSGR